jgi:hypothetical protein
MIPSWLTTNNCPNADGRTDKSRSPDAVAVDNPNKRNSRAIIAHKDYTVGLEPTP